MGAELNFSEEAFEVGAEQLAGYPIASSDRWDAASDVIRVAAPLIVAAELDRLADAHPGYGEAVRDHLRKRASELRGEV